MEQTIHILVVDDEPDIRRILHIMLEHQGYRVHEAINGRRAVEYIRENPDTDLILMDIMMPELGGVEASREIRSISSAPILFLTAKSQERDMLQAYQSGGDDYLVKPFSSAELLSELLLYGICAISLTSTGSRQPGIRVCVSQLNRPEQFELLETRLTAFGQNHR